MNGSCWHQSLALSLVVALTVVGCQRTDRAPAADELGRPELLVVPEPDVSTGDEAVRQQIEDKLSEIRGLLAQPAAEKKEIAQAFGDLGLIYVTYDFVDAAQVCFENSRRLTPQDFRWPYLVGYIAAIQGRIPEAVPLLTAALELDPEFVPAMLRLGRAQLEQGDPAAARIVFRRALERDPRSTAALEGLGKVAVAERDFSKAVDFFSRALELEPSASSLNYMLGQAYRQLGDLDQAAKYLERRGDVAVRIPDPLINPLSQLGESAQFYLVQGQEALNDKSYEVAVGAYTKALEFEPTSFVAYKALSYGLEKLGDLEGAIANLEEALREATTGDEQEDRSERAEVHRVLGGLEALQGEDVAAAEHFIRSLELLPDQPSVHLKLANALARTGRLAEAVPHYDRVVESSPEHAADVLIRRAAAMINLGRPDEARADFRRAIQLKPEDRRLRLRYAEALDFLGDAQGASEERALAMRGEGDDSERLGVLVQMGDSQLRQGHNDEAIKSFRQALDLAPTRADVRFRLASVLAHLGRYDEALGEFRQVVDKEPRNAAARRAEITALILSQRYGEARVRLNDAMRLFTMDSALAHLQARLLATSPDPRVRDGRLAVEVAKRLDQAVPSPRVRETLALAQAEAGNLGEARRLLRDLMGQAEATGQVTLAGAVRQKLEAVERGSGWWASGPEEILEATLGGA